MVKRYDPNNPECFIHKNTGKKPHNKISDTIRNDIVVAKTTLFPYHNFDFFAEDYNELRKTHYSSDVLRNICYESNIRSPKTHKETAKRLDIKFDISNKNTKKTDSETHKPDYLINLKSNQHCAVLVKPLFGARIEIDACEGVFFGNEKSHLHLFVDRATGWNVAACIAKQETLEAYRICYAQMLHRYGRNQLFVADCRSCFTNNRTELENSKLIQFHCWNQTTGADMYTTSVPQRKPKVERNNQTLKNRLRGEFAKYGVTTIEEANKVLPLIIDKYNKKFAKNPDLFESVFLPVNEKKMGTVEEILSYRRPCVVRNDSTVKICKKTYCVVYPNTEKIVNIKPRTKAMMLFAMNGKMTINIDDAFYDVMECTSYSAKKIPCIQIPEWLQDNYKLKEFEKERIKHPVTWNRLFESPKKVCYNN